MEKNFKYINLEYLNEISSSIEFKKKIFYLFKKEIKDIENKMIISLENNNIDELAELAHKAKSTVSILGMKSIAVELKVLESDIKKNIEIDTYKKRINDFLASCNSAIEEIEILEKHL